MSDSQSQSPPPSGSESSVDSAGSGRPKSAGGRLRAAGYLRPGFIAAVVVLVGSVIGLQSLIAAMGLVLVKEPLPLRRNLEEMRTRFGPYELVERHDKLPEAMEEVLGTTDYISWVFRDTRLEREEPAALIRLHVPYYTGQIDSVPHVPDRCFVAGGAQPNLKEVVTAQLASRHIRADGARVTALTEEGTWTTLPSADVPMTVVRFSHEEDPDAAYTVAYFFVANNDYVATPEGVRIKAFNPFERHAYWAKIEVLPYGVADPRKTRDVVGEFLSHALPEVMLCLPDWEQVSRQDDSASTAMR